MSGQLRYLKKSAIIYLKQTIDFRRKVWYDNIINNINYIIIINERMLYL